MTRIQCGGKIVYRDKERAMERRKRVAEKYGKRQHVYECRECGFWHLTTYAIRK